MGLIKDIINVKKTKAENKALRLQVQNLSIDIKKLTQAKEIAELKYTQLSRDCENGSCVDAYSQYAKEYNQQAKTSNAVKEARQIYNETTQNKNNNSCCNFALDRDGPLCNPEKHFKNVCVVPSDFEGVIYNPTPIVRKYKNNWNFYVDGKLVSSYRVVLWDGTKYYTKFAE